MFDQKEIQSFGPVIVINYGGLSHAVKQFVIKGPTDVIVGE